MHPSYYKRPLLWLLILYIIGLFFFYTPSPGSKDVSHFIRANPVTIIGKVVGFPAIKKKSNNVIVKVYSVNGYPARGYVYARFPETLPAWHETLQITGKLKKPYSVQIPGNFDWASYLATKHVFSEIKASEVQTMNPPGFFSRTIAGVRRDILKTFEQNFDTNLAAIAGGVLLGECGEIDEQLYTDFQDSGAIHLLVASGGNVGFVTLIVFAFCSLFGIGRRKTVWLALSIAGVYTFIAGADAPLMRAYFMTVCAVIGYFFHRNSGVFQGLIISCLIILLGNPAAVFETGFQMSFLATLAIIICLNVYELPYPWPRWAKFFMQIFMATLSTQLVLLPVFTNVFFKVSLVGLISNMLLVPAASFLMAVSFLFYVFSLLHIGIILKPIVWVSLFSFQKAVEFFASLSLASIPAAAWRPGWIVSYYAGLFLLFHLPQKEFIRKLYRPVLAVMVLAPVLQYTMFNPPTVWLLNEWNKNVILLRTPSGKRFLIGASLEGEKLARAILRTGGRTLDGILLYQDNEKELKNIKTLSSKIKVQEIVQPFETVWPGETIAVSGLPVTALWGKQLNREKKLWTHTGYSGNQDTMSYQINLKKGVFITAGNGRFILYKEQIFENEQNRTWRVKL